jgi:hypothetical protein
MRVHFELLDERSQMRRNGSRGGVVLLLKALTNGCERDTPLKSGIDAHMSGTGRRADVSSNRPGQLWLDEGKELEYLRTEQSFI